MNKGYYSLGLMSGTSGDGVDASIIRSDGQNQYQSLINRYFKYNGKIQQNIYDLKDKIENNPVKLNEFSEEVSLLEKNITIFHAEAVNNILKETTKDIDFIGFHGQTILHSPLQGLTKQLGDGKLLSNITKKTVIYDFRQNDLINGGQGAPLTPIFHRLLKNKHKLMLPLIVINIGGITNLTYLDLKNQMYSQDIGPGNCLIDQWIRHNSEKSYDNEGEIAKLGKTKKTILNKALKDFARKKKNKSYDVKDFDLSFVKGLSIEDGAATLTEYTTKILCDNMKIYFQNSKKNILITGGGRKNKFLIKSIEEKIQSPVKLIDDFKIDGDFVESQAFAYLAIRSFLKLPISFPETTGCKAACTGGVVIKNN